MLSDLKYRIRAVLRGAEMDREADEELRFHFDREVARLIASGISRSDAERRARLTIGGPEQLKEACRDARGVSALETTIRDLRYAARQVRRSPGFSLAVIVSLALGIGANTAIFTLIDALLLRSLPVTRPEQLYFIARRQPTSTTFGYSYKEFEQLQAANHMFDGVAAYATTRLNVSIDGSVEPTAEGHLVSGTYFQVLGVAPSLGRAIDTGDDRLSSSTPVAVLSYAYWKRRFALDPSVVGRIVTLSGVPFTIVGVAARDFSGLEVGRVADIFVPVTQQPVVMPAAENWLVSSIAQDFWLTIVGRLGADRTPAQAAAMLSGLDVLEPVMTKPTSRAEQPQRVAERLDLTPAATGLSSLRDQFSTPLAVLMLAVGIVLVIACANVASLVLARAAARASEFSLRLALGAGGWRLIRQLLTESLLLASIGGLCGLVLAKWTTAALVALMSAGGAPIALDLQPSPSILAFTAAASLASGILCGLAPAMRARRVDVAAGLSFRTGGADAGHWSHPARWLVVSQVALCLVLLFAAGVFLRSLRAVQSQDGGFDRTQVLVMRVEPRGSDQRGVPGASERLDATYRDLIQRVQNIPGVQSASMAHYGPTGEVVYAEPLRLATGELRRIRKLMVYPRYFETMGLVLRAGRDLDERDLDANAASVGVVNEAFVRQVMNGESPVGRHLTDWRGRMREIVGVVADSRYATLRGDTPPLMYQPFLQTTTGRGQMTLHVRTAADADGIAARVREEVQRIDRSMPLFPIQTLAGEVNGVLSSERLVATLCTLFGLLSLLLACVGLYGLMAFAVVRRTREMGIRLALGATGGGVARLVLRESLTLVLAGVAIGVPAALIMGRLAANRISGLVFGLSTTDPITMAGAAALLMAVAALAAYLPAARASRTDPLAALRSN